MQQNSLEEDNAADNKTSNSQTMELTIEPRSNVDDPLAASSSTPRLKLIQAQILDDACNLATSSSEGEIIKDEESCAEIDELATLNLLDQPDQNQSYLKEMEDTIARLRAWQDTRKSSLLDSEFSSEEFNVRLPLPISLSVTLTSEGSSITLLRVPETDENETVALGLSEPFDSVNESKALILTTHKADEKTLASLQALVTSPRLEYGEQAIKERMYQQQAIERSQKQVELLERNCSLPAIAEDEEAHRLQIQELMFRRIEEEVLSSLQSKLTLDEEKLRYESIQFEVGAENLAAQLQDFNDQLDKLL